MPSDSAIVHAGIVQSVDDGEAVIVIAATGCAACGKKSACGIGKLAAGQRTTQIRLPATQGMQAGDQVSISAGQGEVNRAALLGYLLPAGLIVCGMITADQLFGSDASAAFGGGAGLMISLAATRLIACWRGREIAPLTLHKK